MRGAADATTRNIKASNKRDDALLARIKALEVKLRDEMKAVRAALKRHGVDVPKSP